LQHFKLFQKYWIRIKTSLKARRYGIPGGIITQQQSLIIGTAEKSMKILEIQREGGQRMTAADFINAYKSMT